MAQKDFVDRVREKLAAEGAAPSAHREAIEEIAEHLNDLHQAALREGLSETDASRRIEAELARMGRLAMPVAERDRRRQHATDHSDGWLAGMTADFRQAFRSIRINRGFSAVVILTLAVGIGSCTAVFSIINALLWGSLPYPNPEQLTLAWESSGGNRAQTSIVAYPNYEDWQRETRSFQSMGVFEWLSFNVASDQRPEQVQGLRASSSLFTVLGVPPALGRVFSAEEEKPGHRVAVVSDAVWRTHLGADPSAIGRELRLNGEAFSVIGVMPPGFQFPRQGYGVWVPFAAADRDRERGAHSFWVAARLKPEVTFESARADIEQVGRALEQRFEENRDEGATLTPMPEHGLRTVRTMLTALMGAVALVLVIGCVNVANLQLGRALARRREFVVRLALGASLGRLARQLFTESLALAIAGGIGGLALAWLGTQTADLVLAEGFRSLPFRGEVPITIDARVLGFAAAASIVAAALFGFAPLVGLRRRDPQVLLREGTRGSTGAANIARRTLVAVEVGLAIVVLCGAGLLIKSLSGLMSVNPGLDPREVLTLSVSLPQENTYGAPVRESFCADLSRAADGLPGLRSVSAVSHLPLAGANAGRGLTIEGRVAQSADDNASAGYRLACPRYFSTLTIPLIEGRDFTDRDRAANDKVAIINRAMAERYWPGQSPLGKRFKMGSLQNDNPWISVVGVVDNARHFGLDSDVRREFFMPYSQYAWPTMTVVAKTVGEPMLWQSALRDVVQRVDPDLPAGRIQSMEAIVEWSVSWRQTPMRLLTGFALIGLLLVSLGVYGVLAYYVSQRTREIGVRAALGATKQQLASLVVRQSLLPMIAGAALGVAGSFATGRLLQDFLYQVRPGDPQVLGTIVGLLLIVGLLASWLPARRAAAIDPMTALRDE
jgi:putative ABC transport system permease protein